MQITKNASPFRRLPINVLYQQNLQLMEKIIDYFSLKNENKDAIYVAQERTLIIFLLSALLLSLFSIPVYTFLKINTLSNLLYALLIVSSLLLAYFKIKKNLKVTSFFLITFLLVYLFLNIIYTGGADSSLIVWITLLPIFAIILNIGLTQYTLWGCVLMLIAVFMLDYWGVEFVDLMDEKLKVYYTFFNRINFMVIIVFIIFNYDKKKKIDHENLKKSNKELEQFAYVASHDMKAPLRNIISFAQILQRKIKGKIDEKDEKYLDHILSNGHQMNELIQGILNMSSIEKQEHFVLKETDLNEVLDKVKFNLSNDLKAKNVILEAEDLPVIMANQGQIIQLFQNLIENGIKYNRSETPKIVISKKREGKFLNLYFKDNGIGIAPQYYDKIFEMFKRLHSGYEFTGTGIGFSDLQKKSHFATKAI